MPPRTTRVLRGDVERASTLRLSLHARASAARLAQFHDAVVTATCVRRACSWPVHLLGSPRRHDVMVRTGHGEIMFDQSRRHRCARQGINLLVRLGHNSPQAVVVERKGPRQLPRQRPVSEREGDGEVLGRLVHTVIRQRRLNPRDHQLRGLAARGLTRRRQRE